MTTEIQSVSTKVIFDVYVRTVPGPKAMFCHRTFDNYDEAAVCASEIATAEHVVDVRMGRTTIVTTRETIL
jgi:hypothetical protein